MAGIDMAFWASIILACGNGADPRLVAATLELESGGNPNAEHVNRDLTIDAGGMQVNQINWGRFGLTRETAKDPCRSVDAGTKHMIADGGPDAVTPQAIDALLAERARVAIAKYNPGDPTRVDKIVGIMTRGSPVVRSPNPTPKPHRSLASQFPKVGER